MDPLSPFFALIIYLIAFATAYVLNSKFSLSNDLTRYETIDGLRGFLALGVFIHHASIWYQYLQLNKWEAPKSNLFCQLGYASVSIFFMITAFLFVTKLLNAGTKKMDWNIFFISRLFRLLPMYLISIIFLMIIVAVTSHWELKVPLIRLIKDIFYWITFTIILCPEINNNSLTSIINAGVVWSLPYEWLFYFSLPIIAILISRINSSIFYIIVGVLFIIGFYQVHEFNFHILLEFCGGAIAPFIIKYTSKKINYNAIIFTLIIIFCLMMVLFYRFPNDYISKILIILAFNLIALGNDVFGILRNSTLKFLGEISYSTYLLHGIIIFFVIYFYFNFEDAKNLSPLKYCITLFIITPIVVITSFLFYKNVEKPFMIFSKKINFQKLKEQLSLSLGRKLNSKTRKH